MAEALSKDAKQLLDQIASSGRSRGNTSLRNDLGWEEPRYWAAHAELLRTGYAKAGRGKGGSIKDVLGDRHDLLKLIPANGAPIGNVSLRDQLGWDDARYWRVRDELLADGLVVRGQGKGGSVRRVVEAAGEISPAQPEQPSISSATNNNEYDKERSLYGPIAGVLKSAWAHEQQLQEVCVEITAFQGRRSTGGVWTRPDLVVLSKRSFALSNSVLFDVVSFEVKRGWDVTAIFEASAHSASATQSYALLHVSASDGDEERCISEARRMGIGLIVATAPGDFGEWEERVAPVRRDPDPAKLEEFLNTQLGEETKATLLRWWGVESRSP